MRKLYVVAFNGVNQPHIQGVYKTREEARRSLDGYIVKRAQNYYIFTVVSSDDE